MADHLGLDLDLVELLSRVDTDDAADHLGDDNHVTEVGLDEVGLLVGLGLLLGLAELLDETHGLALETTVEPSAGTGMDEVAELLRAEVEELVEVDTTVGKLAERSLPLKLCKVYRQPMFHRTLRLRYSPTRRLDHFVSMAFIGIFAIGCSVQGKGEVFVTMGCAYRQPPRRSVSLLAASASG